MNELFITCNHENIINQLELKLYSNQISAILGPNGTGKSTLFKIVMGVIPSKTTDVKINKTNISLKSVHERVKLGLAYLPQDKSIFRKMSVKENLLSANNDPKVLESVIQNFQLSNIINRYGNQLSGGQTRKVELARCMMLKPKFMLLDEPFAGIDPKTIEELKSVLCLIHKENVGLIITDHQAEKTMEIADKIFILNNGKLLASGTKEEITQNPFVRKIYLG